MLFQIRQQHEYRFIFNTRFDVQENSSPFNSHQSFLTSFFLVALLSTICDKNLVPWYVKLYMPVIQTDCSQTCYKDHDWIPHLCKSVQQCISTATRNALVFYIVSNRGAFAPLVLTYFCNIPINVTSNIILNPDRMLLSKRSAVSTFQNPL